MVEKSHTAGGWYPSVLRPFHEIGQRMADFFAPQSDAAATGDQYEINVELPGVAVEDIDIDIDENSMTIRGEKKSEREEKGKTYFFSERAYGSFLRSFRLPANADVQKIAATFKDGVLSITIPKAGPPPEKARRVEIKST